MWSLRILSGKQAGQIFVLKTGRNLIGRSLRCTINLDSPNVSKEHAFLDVDVSQNISIQDNQSRNGTFVNGVQIKKVKLTKGSKISFNDVICEIIETPKPNSNKLTPLNNNKSQNSMIVSPGIGSLQNNYSANGNLAISGQNNYYPGNSQGYPQNNVNLNLVQAPNLGSDQNLAAPAAKTLDLKYYIDEVLLPGVYRLTELIEFKLVIGLFLIGYAFILTALSTIPMVAISSESIQIESRRRALTIARSLANMNQQALLHDSENSLTTSLAELEEGVSSAYIIRFSDGSVMAPAAKIGAIPNIPFIEMARKEQKEFVKQIDSSHIGVSVPLSAYNADLGGFNIKALSIVIYDMGSLAVEDGRTISLFMQTLCLAIILGAALYFLFYKLIEYPIYYLNNQVDLALKNKSQSTEPIKMEFPIFQSLVTKVNTILSRISHVENNNNSRIIINKDIEASNLVQLVGYAAIGISKDYNIITLNNAFESLLGVSEFNLKNQPISLIPDQALQKSIHELMDRSGQDPGQIHQSDLEFGGIGYQLNCICGFDKNAPAYYIVSIIQMSQGG